MSTISPSARIKPEVRMESPVHISPHTFFMSGSIGRYTFINWNCEIFDQVHIGRFSTFARNVVVGGVNHPMSWLSTSFAFVDSHQFADDPGLASMGRLRRTDSKETHIGNDVWVGANSLILKGVRIGDGAVVGAGSVVAADVPPYAIVAGNPARILRMRFDPLTVADLMTLQWWNLEISLLQGLPFNDVPATINELKRRLANQEFSSEVMPETAALNE